MSQSCVRTRCCNSTYGIGAAKGVSTVSIRNTSNNESIIHSLRLEGSPVHNDIASSNSVVNACMSKRE